MITAPHQRLPCVEDSALSLIQGDRAPSRCMKYTSTEKRAKAMGPDAPARKAREGESLDIPTREAREGEESHDTPTREARKGEESPDAPALEGEESPDALKGSSYQPSRFRRTITPVVYAPTRGVQLGRIA